MILINIIGLFLSIRETMNYERKPLIFLICFLKRLRVPGKTREQGRFHHYSLDETTAGPLITNYHGGFVDGYGYSKGGRLFIALPFARMMQKKISERRSRFNVPSD